MLQNQSTSKINKHCIAVITLTIDHSLPSVSAKVYHIHYVHNTRLGHLRLSQEDRLKIAGKITQGVTYNKMLDVICNSVSDEFERIHLIQRKDINNIQQSLKLEGGQRHSDDATSVAAWVEEMRGKGEDNVVFFYKPQGVDDERRALKKR